MINWGLLYSQGKCKSMGVPWTEEEREAVFLLKVPVEYVRQGCLTMEDYGKAKAKKDDLVETAAMLIDEHVPESLGQTQGTIHQAMLHPPHVLTR